MSSSARGAVGERRGVAGGDGAVLAVEHRLELAERLEAWCPRGRCCPWSATVLVLRRDRRRASPRRRSGPPSRRARRSGARRARCWSCSSREMPFSLAIFSALSPMVMAGGVLGDGRGHGHAGPSALSFWKGLSLLRQALGLGGGHQRVGQRAAGEDGRRPTWTRCRRRWRRPPRPRAMALAAVVMAWMEVAQARATVCASILRGSPAASTTSRAMDGAVSVGMTCPKTTWSISCGSSSARCTSSWTTIRPRSSAVRLAKTRARLHERGPQTRGRWPPAGGRCAALLPCASPS